MSAVGYLPYLAFVFLPGIGLGELIGIWKSDDNFTARLGYAFGLGIGVDTIVILVRTSGLASSLTGLDSGTVYATIALGAVALIASVAYRRRFSWWARPNKLDLGFLALVVVQGVIILLYMEKYPLYPSVYTTDFSIHARNTVGLITGMNTSVPRGILYDGVYFQLAPSVVLVGGSALTTIRFTMAILAVLSPSLVYLAALRLSKNQLLAFMVALVYVISGIVWFQMIFLLGLYSNFFGILASLFLLIAFIDVATGSISRGPMLALVVATIMAYFSHYSIVTLFPAILLLPFVSYLVNRKGGIRKQLVAAGVVALPGLAGVVAYPQIIHILFRANLEAVPLVGSTALSKLVAGWPFLSYLIYRVQSDVAFVVLAALACFFVWKMVGAKAVLPIILIVWFASNAAAAPFDSTAWRYSLEAFVPLTLMAGIGLFALLPKSKAGKGRQNSRSYYWKMAVVLVLVVAPIATSYSSLAVTDAVSNVGLSRLDQTTVNQTITWLGTHTPANSTYLSVSNILFIYTKGQLDRRTIYQFESTPTEALQVAQQDSAGYIIVGSIASTYLSNSALYPWNTFPTTNGTNPDLSLIYQNPDVRVYQII